jgi:hypothetical protein
MRGLDSVTSEYGVKDAGSFMLFLMHTNTDTVIFRSNQDEILNLAETIPIIFQSDR